MSEHFNSGMAEATRLTRAGRLGEATAFLQRLLRGDAAPEPDAADRTTPKPTVLDVGANSTAPQPPRSQTSRPRRGLRETLRRLAERARALDVEDPARAPDMPGGARFDTATFRNAEGARDYKLYVPASRGAGPTPLVVMLHGCTQDPDDFARGTGMNAAAEEAGVLIAYPSQPGSANLKRCWNWFRPEDQRRDAGEPALIAGIARAIMAAENVDPHRVYVAGLSAGGATAAIMGAEYPEIFAALGVHSGLPHGAAQDLPSALSAMRQGAPGAGAARAVPTIVFHGDADRVVHPRNAAALVAQATAAVPGLRTRVEHGEAGGRGYILALHEDADGRTLCEHWTIHGAGHAWAGGDAAGSNADPLGPDVSREMLRFLLSQRR